VEITSIASTTSVTSMGLARRMELELDRNARWFRPSAKLEVKTRFLEQSGRLGAGGCAP
jgi:hypothetical protein